MHVSIYTYVYNYTVYPTCSGIFRNPFSSSKLKLALSDA